MNSCHMVVVKCVLSIYCIVSGHLINKFIKLTGDFEVCDWYLNSNKSYKNNIINELFYIGEQQVSKYIT